MSSIFSFSPRLPPMKVRLRKDQVQQTKHHQQKGKHQQKIFLSNFGILINYVLLKTLEFEIKAYVLLQSLFSLLSCQLFWKQKF